MTNIIRKVQKIFGGNFIGNAAQTDISEFGSKKSGSAQYSTNPDDIQTSAYEGGWNDATINDGTKKIP